ncbi:MAG: chloride channel protein [Actinomycetia bacterium]|nr:chloride channel protein [Actinomycetes bacterium]
MNPPLQPAALLRLIGVAIVLGLVAALGAAVFTWVEHELQHWLWESLPQTLGWEEPAWWWVLAVLLAGALLVYGAVQLPGRGGHSPLAGLGFDLGPDVIISVVLAALASLAFGAVLGPEAPLLAIGTALGYLALRNPSTTQREVLMLAGAMAAVSIVFGNPLVIAILLLEGVLLGAASKASPMLLLLPTLAALGSGYVLQVGIGAWSGFESASLSLPGLPSYPTLQIPDLILAVPVALGVGLLVVLAVRLAEWFEPFAKRQVLPALLLGAAVIAVVALLSRAITGFGVELVLFSGQAAMPELITISSIGALAVIATAKAIAYALSMSIGFRGGLVFPAVFLGVAVAAATALIVESSSVTALAAAGIAAAVAATIRLPFTAVMLAVLLIAPAGLAVTSIAIIGAVLGLLVRLGIDGRFGPPAAGADIAGQVTRPT